MIEKLKETIRTIIDNLSPIEYGIANLTAMMTIPITLIIMRILAKTA